jgi:hypothetical protein
MRRLVFVHRLQHLATLLGTVATSAGAGGHLFVIRVGLAGLRAVIAAGGATFQHVMSERAVAGTERCAGLAALSAVDAVLGSLGVRLFAFTTEHLAMTKTCVASDLAVRTHFSALFHVRGVVRAIATGL